MRDEKECKVHNEKPRVKDAAVGSTLSLTSRNAARIESFNFCHVMCDVTTTSTCHRAVLRPTPVEGVLGVFLLTRLHIVWEGGRDY